MYHPLHDLLTTQPPRVTEAVHILEGPHGAQWANARGPDDEKPYLPFWLNGLTGSERASVLAAFVAAGGNVDAPNRHGETAAMVCAETVYYPDEPPPRLKSWTLFNLLDHGASLVWGTDWSSGILHSALRNRVCPTVPLWLIDALLKRGAPPNAGRAGEWGPLMRAVQNSASLEVVACLLGAGASPVEQDSTGESPLSWWARHGRVKPYPEFEAWESASALADRLAGWPSKVPDRRNRMWPVTRQT